MWSAALALTLLFPTAAQATYGQPQPQTYAAAPDGPCQAGRATRVLVGAFMVGQGTDLATTMYGLGAGRFREANPILSWAEDRPVAMGAAKMALATGSSYTLLRFSCSHPRATAWLAGGLTLLQGWATWHNSQLLRD